MQKQFFDVPLDQSVIKGQIVANYFPTWARIISKQASAFGFVDLYCGPGRYVDRTPSTPLLVLQRASESRDLFRNMLCFFNDKDQDNIQALEKELLQFSHLTFLETPPQLCSKEVTNEIVGDLQQFKNMPTFSFLDPWGYKGLSLELIKFAIRSSWGSECVFFFNYNRINAAIANENVESHMAALWGKHRLENLKGRLHELSPFQREQEVIDSLCEALNHLGATFVLPFCFKHAEQEKTSHYLVFAGTHALGYGIMKEIMAEPSQKDSDGIPTYTYDPKPRAQLELSFNRPFKELLDALAVEFAGKTLSVKNIYEGHQKKTRYTKQNYKDALLCLERQGTVSVDSPPEKRPRHRGKLTLGDQRSVTFQGRT